MNTIPRRTATSTETAVDQSSFRGLRCHIAHICGESTCQRHSCSSNDIVKCRRRETLNRHFVCGNRACPRSGDTLCILRPEEPSTLRKGARRLSYSDVDMAPAYIHCCQVVE